MNGGSGVRRISGAGKMMRLNWMLMVNLLAQIIDLHDGS